MAVFREVDLTPNDSSDDDINEDMERSGFEDEVVDDIPATVQSPARWSSQFTFLSLADSPLTVNSQSRRLAPANYLPHEILIHIFRQVTSSRDLYTILLVSRAWCQCSVELLWHKPQFNKLGSIFKMIHVLGKKDAVFEYATFIRRLNFTLLGHDLSDQYFVRLAACVRLERLTLFGCSALSDDYLHCVLRCCPNLVALDLTGVVGVTDLSICGLAASSPRLQGINLGGCKQVTDAGIVALAEGCRNLRRIKLSGLETLTDVPVTALSKHCPLLLELDLHNCPLVTDTSIRDLWTHSSYLRELRLSNALNLTERAFPMPPVKPGTAPPSLQEPQPALKPLYLSRPFDHLRMLDLTGCGSLNDEAMEGIVVNCPKIRNLVLAKCSQLTDEAIASICKLGRHLHYLHLGHVSNITDRAVTGLARACSRLRYIDLACCPLLTDMSVFELAVLPKLRRIGLVRVPNLTDQAIYSLGESHTSLERIHLSYCENISVQAINYLLQRLLKLTHLSLTGIPAFRRPELQKFCRPPPKEFTQNQRAAFCVYSGHGVSELRRYLQAWMASMAENERSTGRGNGGDGGGSDDDDDTDAPNGGGHRAFFDLKEDEDNEGTVIPTLSRQNSSVTFNSRPPNSRTGTAPLPLHPSYRSTGRDRGPPSPVHTTTVSAQHAPTTTAMSAQGPFVWPPPGPEAAALAAGMIPDPRGQPGVWVHPPSSSWRHMNGTIASPSTQPLPYPLTTTARASHTEPHNNGTVNGSGAGGNISRSSAPTLNYGPRPAQFSFSGNHNPAGTPSQRSHNTNGQRNGAVLDPAAPGTTSFILAGAGRGRSPVIGTAQSAPSVAVAYASNHGGGGPSHPLSLQNVNANDGGPSVRHWAQSQVNGTPSPAPSPSISAAAFASSSSNGGNAQRLSPTTGASFMSSWRNENDESGIPAATHGQDESRTELRALEESLHSALGGTVSASSAAVRGRDRQRGTREFPVVMERDVVASDTITPISTSGNTPTGGPTHLQASSTGPEGPSTSRQRP